MIQLQIEYIGIPEIRTLTYDLESCSFDMEPIVKKWDYELVVNKVCLCVIDKKIIQLSGFCGFSEWKLSNYIVPSYKPGQLRVLTELDDGFCYGVNEKDYPIYVNDKSGWVCIGNPLIQQEAVEFIDNCVAVIENKTLAALWLKPIYLPSFPL